MTRTVKKKAVRRETIRSDLDPMFYQDIEAFRKAVADGTVGRAKGCRNMTEYLWSVNHASV